MTAVAPAAVETLTPRQAERRRRVLDAVHALVAERPVAEVQVKEIAERSGASLAAIYRYFSSKDHLLGEALVDWAEGLVGGPRRPATFEELVRRGVRAYARAPQYAELFLVTTASRDPFAVECLGRLSQRIGGAMASSLGERPDADDLQRIVGHAWTGGLYECVHGMTTWAELERSIGLLCRLVAPS